LRVIERQRDQLAEMLVNDMSRPLDEMSGHPESIERKCGGSLCQRTSQPLRRHSSRLSLGLGLFFCKLAVAAQGGTLGVEDEPGVGRNFWFTLPAVAENC